MTPAVGEAIEEISKNFESAVVTVREDGEGGAYVRIEAVDPGPPYAQRQTWIAFRITAQYPYADVYPLFVRPDLGRADGRPLGQAMAASSFDGHPAIQVSRRYNHLDPTTDTAALKVRKVLRWMASR
ncbi:MAG: hypothetical protein ACYDH5_06720 [Acidimicrobiales bacterium]